MCTGHWERRDTLYCCNRVIRQSNSGCETKSLFMISSRIQSSFMSSPVSSTVLSPAPAPRALSGALDLGKSLLFCLFISVWRCRRFASPSISNFCTNPARRAYWVRSHSVTLVPSWFRVSGEPPAFLEDFLSLAGLVCPPTPMSSVGEPWARPRPC